MRDIPTEVVERILEEVHVGLTLIDQEGNVVWSNAVARQMLGWQQQEHHNVYGCHKPEIQEMIHKKLINACFDKEWHRIIQIENLFIENVYSPVIIPGNFAGVMMFSRDVSEREQMLNTIWEKSIRDPLTNLFNRRYFDQVYQKKIQCPKPFGIIMADVNGLKFVNDTYGHLAGDKFLISAGQILRTCVRNQDAVFRIGGDEFVIVVECNKSIILDTICSRIRRRCHMSRDNQQLGVSLSIGACLSSEVSRPEDALAVADQRMYEDKAKHYHTEKEQNNTNE